VAGDQDEGSGVLRLGGEGLWWDGGVLRWVLRDDDCVR